MITVTKRDLIELGYGHLYPNTNIEIAKKLTGVLSYQSASQSIANYTSNQHTAMYHKEI